MMVEGICKNIWISHNRSTIYIMKTLSVWLDCAIQGEKLNGFSQNVSGSHKNDGRTSNDDVINLRSATI